ncbi:MAG: flagellar filament capping protein FliD [Dehalococcoidia bacterium]
MVSSSSGRITFGGLASGIDTNSIVSQLMAIQQRPIFKVMDRVDAAQAKINAYNSLKTAMSTLMSSAAPLKDPTTFGQRSTIVGTAAADQGKVTATATNGAALQKFTFQGLSLATATTASSSQAMGAAIDANVPLDEAGFGGAITAGTFSINGTTFTIAEATATTYDSGASIGASFSASAMLSASNADVLPTSGSVVINGHTVNFDADNDSLNDVIARINAAVTDVIASYDDTTKTFRLEAKETGPSTITIADSNGGTLFQSLNMLDGGGGNVGTITTGTDLVSLQDVIDDINNAAIGVTASIENDGLGRPNLFRLTGGASVQTGSGGDTSNFLALTGILESPAGATRTGVRGMGQAQQSADLEDARLATALSGSSGTFKVNGIEIAWDATSDSLQNVITRINSSGAGVTATYDAFTDQMVLTADDMGGTAIQLEDVTGNFLAATELLSATQSLGVNASYSVNGGPTRYSTSNVITDVVPGVTITMNDLTDDPVKISVNLATSGISTAVGTFVTNYNKTIEGIRSLTKYDPEGTGNGLLFGDATVQRLEGALRSSLTGAQDGMPGGLRTLSDIGVSFGAVGAAVGTTNDLIFDAAKFTAKLQSDPEAVAALLTAFTASASLDAGGTGSLASISGTPTGATKAGRYSVSTDTFGNIEATFQANDGSAPQVTTGTITAGGTNTTLIPGLTLTAQGALVQGTDLITIAATTQGFGKTVHEYLNAISRSGGLLATRADEMQTQIADMNQQIDRMNARLSARETALMRKFSAMEQAISRLQGQQQQLAQITAQLAK